MMRPEAAAWVAPIVQSGEKQGLPIRTIAKEILRTGRPLSVDEKSERSFPINLPLSDEYASALTELGRHDPERAANLVGHRAMMNFYLDRSLEMARRLRAEIRISVVDDRGNCPTAMSIHGKFFQADDVPSLPLEPCTADMCRCGYQVITASSKKRFWPDRQ